MRVNTNLFWIVCAFFVVTCGAYTVWGLTTYVYSVEWVGTVSLGLCAIMSGFIAFFLGRTRSAQGGELPEDRIDGNIDDGDPELGHFSPWSWWPIMLAGSAAIFVLGLAVGFWICFIAVPIALISLVGWVFEYYRGYFAR